MNRQSPTELDKIVEIGFARIDQVIERACEELDGTRRYLLSPLPDNHQCIRNADWAIFDMELKARESKRQRLEKSSCRRYYAAIQVGISKGCVIEGNTFLNQPAL